MTMPDPRGKKSLEKDNKMTQPSETNPQTGQVTLLSDYSIHKPGIPHNFAENTGCMKKSKTQG